ncbi:hypothetical protein C8R44DRAFT_800734 [Mycena epipterygia]|nr:hypothetical protein C8R44DRAFT_800734 [Mycena epipterygia]
MPTHNRENELPESSPPQKKAKKEAGYAKPKGSDTASNLKRSKCAKSKAKLSLLPSLPLDVLFEIFGHLPPLDILSMARATKDLRRVLMHRSAVSIWKASLRQISGLPECPREMSEPAWANLVFSPYCNNCFANRVQKVDWLLRIRLCESCVKSSTRLRSDKHLDTQANKLDKIVSQCVAFSSVFRMCGHKGKCCLAEEERKFLKELQAEEGNRTEFVKSRKQAMAAREEHAAQCESWMSSLNRDRWDELEQIRRKRRNDIADKLEELGFIEELEYLEYLEEGMTPTRPALQMFDDHPDVKVNKPLTERSWKNMEERLVKYMQQVKAHSEVADRLDIVRQREKVAVSAWVQFRLRYPAERLLPSGTDIISWDSVKAIIELPSCIRTTHRDEAVGEALATKAIVALSEGHSIEHGNPMASTSLQPTTISPASFTRVYESMTSAILAWEAKRTRELGWLAMRRAGLIFPNSPAAHLSNLRLAACVFTCEDKLSIHQWIDHFENHYPAMWYPEFLHHTCTRVERGKDDPDMPPNPLFKASKDISWCRRKEWSTDSLFFDEKASRAVKRLLEACGLEYTVVTTEDMDNLDPRFVCLKCSYGAKCDGQRPRKVMPWRNAVQHCMLVHWGDASVTWEKITEESAVEARTLSAACSSIRTNIWRCAHCCDSPSDRDGKNTEDLMLDHLDAYHNIVEGVVGKDYYQAVDQPPALRPTVKMTPKASY